MDSNAATMTPEAGTADSGASRQAEADRANRESLERAYDRVEARERAVEKQPIIRDEARHVATIIREAKEEVDYRAEGLPVFQNGTPVTVLDSLHAAASRAEAREKAAEARRMPSLPADKSTRERLEASAKWSELSDRDKVAFKAGHVEAQAQKEAAEWFGLTPEQAQLVQIDRRLADRDRVQPTLDRYQKLVPGQNPEATMSNAAAWAEALARDPKGAFAQLGKQLGVIREPTPEQARQFQQRAAQAREGAFKQARAVHAIDTLTQRCPDFGALEEGMLRALQSGRLPRTGDPARDLHAAYRAAGGRYA